MYQPTVLTFGNLFGGWMLATNANFSTISPKLQQLDAPKKTHGQGL